MSIRHQFEILNHCGINVSDTAEELYAQWLVPFASGCVAATRRRRKPNLWQETNVVALVELLQNRHGNAAAKQLNGELGEVVAIIDPGDDAAIATAAALVPQMHLGVHLDEALYIRALDEATDEQWADLDYPERIDLLVTNQCKAALYLQDDAPDCLRAILQERFVF